MIVALKINSLPPCVLYNVLTVGVVLMPFTGALAYTLGREAIPLPALRQVLQSLGLLQQPHDVQEMPGCQRALR